MQTPKFSNRMSVGFQKTTRKTSTDYHLSLLFRLKIDLQNFCGDGEASFYFLSGTYGPAMGPANAQGGLGHCAAFPRLAEASRVAQCCAGY